jgi:alpha-L-fucosidase
VVGEGTSIGACRILRLDVNATTNRVRLRITKSPVSPAISEFGLHREPA